MIFRQTFGDVRQLLSCAFCGGQTGTRDHCPSRVFLDEPYPEQLSVVPSCSACNSGFSKHEQYLACLISCVLAGNTNPENMERLKIKRILSSNPALQLRIEKSRLETEDGVIFAPETDRILPVVLKLAKGHALFELNDPHTDFPSTIWAMPLAALSDEDRREFESMESDELSLWPEVGSRAMAALVEGKPIGYPWLNVQDGRYRYHVSFDSGTSVRIVIHEYLACFVHWNG